MVIVEKFNSLTPTKILINIPVLVTSPYNNHTLSSKPVMRILKLVGGSYLNLTPNSHN